MSWQHEMKNQTRRTLKAQYKYVISNKIEIFGFEPILDLTFYSADLGKEISIRNFLKSLLQTLWEEEESFSGKHPFGNADWKYDVHKCLVKNQYVWGTLDELDYLNELDTQFADSLINDLIIHIFTKR